MHRFSSLFRWLILYVTVHLVVRAWSMWSWSESVPVDAQLLRGIVSDTGMSLVMAAVAVLLGRIHRWLPYALLVLWCVVLAGNYEYIRDWQSNLSYLDMAVLGDKTFFFGSAFTRSLGFLSYSLFLTVLAMNLLLQRWKAVLEFAPYICIAAGEMALLLVILPVNPTQLWVQENIVETNIRTLLTPDLDVLLAGETLESKAAAREAHALLDQVAAQDLQGQLVVAPQSGVNVLVLTIESLSETTLRRGWLPYVQSLADTHMHYTQFVNPNIATIRGEFALMCGGLTNFEWFGHDRIAEHIKKQGVTCLPKILDSHGYSTAYLQCTELDFQDPKDVMPQAGFQEVLGDKQLTEGNRYSHWGLDDASLFMHVQKTIERLEQKNAPWMIMAMTVSTHHPYKIDPAFAPELPDARERAYRFTDQAIKQLISWLETTGRAAHTLVIITGDESRDNARARTPFASLITRNHGFLVVLTPHDDRYQSKEAFVQTDIPVSVLDYLGIAPPADMHGRSVFRQYDRFRPLVFADYAQNALRAVWKPGILEACDTTQWKCTRYELNSTPLFDSTQSFSHPQEVPPDLMQALAQQNHRRWFVQMGR